MPCTFCRIHRAVDHDWLTSIAWKLYNNKHPSLKVLTYFFGCLGSELGFVGSPLHRVGIFCCGMQAQELEYVGLVAP